MSTGASASPWPDGAARHERVAQHAGLAYVELDPSAGGRDPIDGEVAALLPARAARAYAIVPVAVDGRTLVVASATPRVAELRSVVRAFAGLDARVVIATDAAVARAQDRVYGPAAEPAPEARLPLLRRGRRRAEERTHRELARHAGLEFAALERVDPVPAQLLTEETCRALRLIPVAATDDTITVATATPFDSLSLETVRALTGRLPRVVVTAPGLLEEALERAFGRRGERAGVVDEALAGRRRELLGELLVEAGLISPIELDAALRTQARVGGRLGDVLVHASTASETEVAGELARQLRLPLADLSRAVPEADALALVPEPVARRLRLVPLSISEHVLQLAVAEPLDEPALRELRRHTQLPFRQVLATRTQITELLQRTYALRYVRVATTELLNRLPDESAYKVLSRAQKVVFTLLAVAFALVLLRDPTTTLIAFNIASIFFYTGFSLYKFKLIYDALGHDLELPVSDEEVEALDERTLPVYTILVPLYREANVVGRLVEAIARLDYPRSKLDVKLIVEEDDFETTEALRRADLPPHFKLVVVPDALPKTKPKACNYGLIQAEGRYVVIYDAEDRPEPDQLKKAVIAFSKAEERIVCIQCKLNYYNRNQNVLTRWFTTEYSSWFDLFMPGLDAADSPIPLGGTSNHLDRQKLIEVGAWDPFNVTEDADLGIRLHKAGYKTAIVDSTTFEEANSDLYNWIRQRSRWVKGYIQTWLVHMRHPLRLRRQIGWRSFVSFQFVVAGTFVGFLLNPFYWALTTLWLATSAGFIRSLFPGFVYYAAALGLFVGNFVFTYVNVAGSLRRGYHDLVKWALLSPLYWALMSIGAWKGFLQLFYRPFYWEKTVHGLDRGTGQ
jgi:cellulose synthase/poly-beta-1,6-N-acetylglucosamine synthase-like glycosyltransferase